MPILRGPENALTKGMTELEKSLGVDLKVNPDGDLELNNLNDFSLVSGAQNAAQAETLAKMCVILGTQAGISRIDSLGAAALIVDNTNQVHTSQNWETYSC